MGKMDGKVAIVTGGSRGMGAAHVEMLAAEGARVVATDVLGDEGRALADRLGDDVMHLDLDVTDSAAWEQTIAATEDAFGPVDLLVNNAGIIVYGTIEDLDPSDFQRALDVNLVGPFLGMHHVIPSMKRAGGGVIINVSSTAGMVGYGQIGAYVASKWGLRGLTKAAALELGQLGIRVVSVHPGPIATPMTEGMGDESTIGQPIARYGTTEEVAKMVLFLAADATFSTGSEFVIDGGAILGTAIDLSAMDE